MSLFNSSLILITTKCKFSFRILIIGSIKKTYLEMFLRSFNDRKAPIPGNDEIDYFLKSVLYIIQFMAGEPFEIKSLCILLVGKLLLSFGCYLQPTENMKIFFNSIIFPIKSKVQSKDICARLCSISLSILAESMHFKFII